MTIDKVIEMVDGRKPNVFTDEMKAQWLMELDGAIFTEVLRGRTAPALPGEEEELREPPRAYPEDAQVPLLVTAPYDNLYGLYVEAMIDRYNQETMLYNSSAILFDQAMDAFRKQYHRTHEPPAPDRVLVP